MIVFQVGLKKKKESDIFFFPAFDNWSISVTISSNLTSTKIQHLCAFSYEIFLPDSMCAEAKAEPGSYKSKV